MTHKEYEIIKRLLLYIADINQVANNLYHDFHLFAFTAHQKYGRPIAQKL